MSIKDKNIESIKDFIFNDEVQEILSEINSNLMDFNIFEITGMGNQEIKHSNILGWLFDSSEHNLEYKILEDFFKKVILKNQNNKEIEKLKEYIYVSHKQDLKIYRERDNIDLLIVDEQNKILIIIENKVFASERKKGNDGGQLKKYVDKIEKSEYSEYCKFYIFLTIDLTEPSKDNKNWMIANHQMVTDTIEKVIKKNQDLSVKTKIIFESYVDLLKRKKIVEDKDIKELCEKVWNEPKYKEALEVLFNYKPNKSKLILETIKSNKHISEVISKINGSTYNYFIEFEDTELLLRLTYNEKQGLGFVIISKNEEIRDNFKKCKINKTILKKANKGEGQYDYHYISKFAWYVIKDQDDIHEELINSIIEDFKSFIDNTSKF